MGYVIVFELRGGGLVATQEVTYDRQVPGAGETFSPQTGVLVVTGRFEDNAGHCCPDAAVVATFKWQGSAFRVQNVKKKAVSQAGLPAEIAILEERPHTALAQNTTMEILA